MKKTIASALGILTVIFTVAITVLAQESKFVPFSEMNKNAKPGAPKIGGLNWNGSLIFDRPIPGATLVAKGNFKVTRWIMPDGEDWACAEFDDPAKPETFCCRWAKLKYEPDMDYMGIFTTADLTNGFLVIVPTDRLNKTNDIGGPPLTIVTVGKVIFSDDGYQIREVGGRPALGGPGVADISINGKPTKQQVAFYWTKNFRAYLKDKQSGLNPTEPKDHGQFAEERAIFLEKK
ncbi:MAG: hypothetical protein ABSC03_00165 [Verrucomicrobiota bacterium]